MDYFWMESRSAAAFESAEVSQEAPFRPHRPTWLRALRPWKAYRIRALRQPRQWPLDRPLGPDRPPPDYPDLEGAASKERLEQGWKGFFFAAELELQGIFNWGDQQAAPFKGKGSEPQFVWKRLLPRLSSPVAGRGSALAWRWLASELAWTVVLCCRVAKEGKDEHHRQLSSAWHRLLGGVSHWGFMEGLGPAIHTCLGKLKGLAMHVPALRALAAIQGLAVTRAAAWEDSIARRRRRLFMEKLAEKYPGSQGRIHKICQWRAAWRSPVSSALKKPLPSHPQQAVEAEAEEWSAIWQVGKGQQQKLWQLEHLPRLPPLDAEMVRPVCASFKARTGLGADGWHPKHWSWLSEGALRCLATLLAWCEELGTWPEAIRALLIFLVGKPDGWGQADYAFPSAREGVGGPEEPAAD